MTDTAKAMSLYALKMGTEAARAISRALDSQHGCVTARRDDSGLTMMGHSRGLTCKHCAGEAAPSIAASAANVLEREYEEQS